VCCYVAYLESKNGASIRGMVGARIALRYYESLSFSRSPDYRKSADYKRYSARITRPGIEFFAGTMRLKGATVWEVDLLPVD